jgi:hypothetical protein
MCAGTIPEPAEIARCLARLRQLSSCRPSLLSMVTTSTEWMHLDAWFSANRRGWSVLETSRVVANACAASGTTLDSRRPIAPGNFTSVLPPLEAAQSVCQRNVTFSQIGVRQRRARGNVSAASAWRVEPSEPVSSAVVKFYSPPRLLRRYPAVKKRLRASDGRPRRKSTPSQSTKPSTAMALGSEVCAISAAISVIRAMADDAAQASDRPLPGATRPKKQAGQP